MPHLFRNATLALCACLILCLRVSAVYADPLTDGPYLLRTADGTWVARWVEGDEDAPRVKEKTVRRDSSITIGAIGRVPAFSVTVRGPEPVASDEAPLAADAPLFVVADTHGQFEIFVTLLQRHRVIDRRLRWRFGRGHLAILGDVFDRGPHQTQIFWLLYKLEAEARKSGGEVHLVLGNHEILALLGDGADLHPRYAPVTAALNVSSYDRLWESSSLLGQWLRAKPAVKKIGTLLCLHGGISRALLDRNLTLTQINWSVRDVLDRTPSRTDSSGKKLSETLLARDPQASEADKAFARFIMGRDGPLWYRGYFDEPASTGFIRATQDDVDSITRRYGVRSVLVGHTRIESITPFYQGKVIAVHVPMRTGERTGAPIAEALEIRDGQILRASADGSIEVLAVQ